MSESERLQRAALARRLLICGVTGFSSGLPLFLLINLVPAWLRSAGVDLKAIGLLALVQLPYTWKFLWAPLIDRYSFARFGRRRSWVVIMQVALVGIIVSIGWQNPQQMPLAPTDLISAAAFIAHPITLLAMLTALCSATGDIALDAYRRELLEDRELGIGNSIFIATYRISSLVPGSLSLILADHLPWPQVFVVTGLFMLPGIVLMLVVKDPPNHNAMPATLRAAALEPMREFIQRAGWRQAAWILGFIFLYKIGDTLCVSLATPFYLDMGYTKTEIGVVAKNAGLWASVAGGLLGGAWMMRIGIARALWIFGVIQMLSILGFAWLAISSVQGAHELNATVPGYFSDALTAVNGLLQRAFNVSINAAPLDVLRWLRLAIVVAFEAFGVGVGTAAFVAFIAAQTSKTYTATQYALFSSLTAVPRTLINSSAGYIVDRLGWTHFYLLCFVIAVPGMLMLLKVAPWTAVNNAEDKYC